MSRRVATIDRDMELIEPPPTWTADWVRDRLVEAYRIEQRLPGAARRTQSGLWPKPIYEFADVVGWEAQGMEDARQRVLAQWSSARGGVYAVEISRMDEAHGWLAQHLGLQHQVERACLASWATCIAYRRSLRALMLRRRWSRATFYRRVEDGSGIIAAALRKEGVEVR